MGLSCLAMTMTIMKMVVLMRMMMMMMMTSSDIKCMSPGFLWQPSNFRVPSLKSLILGKKEIAARFWHFFIKVEISTVTSIYNLPLPKESIFLVKIVTWKGKNHTKSCHFKRSKSLILWRQEITARFRHFFTVSAQEYALVTFLYLVIFKTSWKEVFSYVIIKIVP